MRISATEEYGLRCLLTLAQEGPECQMSIPEIAEKEGISVPYASKLLWMLRKSGLVNAERGRSGGFSIARSPGEITLHDVITAMGGPLIYPAHCRKYSGNRQQCVHSGKCSLHDILGGLSGMIREFLAEMTVADLISRPAGGVLKKAFVDAGTDGTDEGSASGSGAGGN
jgi:Rrf2 family iron-sulfur cluster assembly transcriptional regulator